VTEIRPLADTDWPAVLRIYAEGIATGDATLGKFLADVSDLSTQ